ncbi:MAG TPA: hypothetical protein VGF69_26000 [Thermoanaerobaculia bacterium]|jgi:hypothetical protein
MYYLCDGESYTFSPYSYFFEPHPRGEMWPSPYSGPLEWSATNATLISGQGTSTATFTVANEGDTPIDVEFSVIATANRRCSHPGILRTTVYRSARQRTIATATSTCPNVSQTASVEKVDGESHWWSIENGTITSFPYEPTITYVANTIGETRLSVKSGGRCPRWDQITIPVSLPSAAIDSATLPTCAGTPVDIDVTLTGAAPFTLRWSDGVIETAGSTTHTRTVMPQASEHYEIVEVTGSGGASCPGTATGAVDVQVSARPEIVDEPKNVTIRNGETATLSVGAVGDGLTFQWYEGASGDTSHPVSGGIHRVLIVTPSQTTRYWADVRSHCGTVFSKAGNVAVTNAPARRRAAR